MEYLIEELTGPTNPNDFVGRNSIIDQYHELLRNFVRSNPCPHWIHISGPPGIGKSSLLRKLRMMTEQERIATASIEVPISPSGAAKFLTEIKQVIEEMSPEWRSFIQRKRNVEISKVDIKKTGDKIDDLRLQEIIKKFFVDFDRVDKAMKEEKMRHGIFLDDLHRFQNYNYDYLLKVWFPIAQKLREDDYNTILVTSSDTIANEFLGLSESDVGRDVLHLELQQFDFTEAELMIRRKGKLVKSDRELAVQSSTRFPFDLALRQLIITKDLDPSNLNAETLINTFSFTKDEVKLIHSLAKSNSNFFELKNYLEHHKEEGINSFRENMVLTITQDGYFAFESTALWELIGQVFKPIDPRTEVLLILTRLTDQASRGQLPSKQDLDIVKQNFAEIDDNSLIFELSGQLAKAAKAALDGKLIKTAWELLDLATYGLEKTKDFEKIADLQENLAKGFAKVEHDYFSAKAYERAGEYFKLANIDWRSISDYREAAQKYQKEAEKTDVDIFHFAIRSMLARSINSFLKANEARKAKRILRDAKELLEKYPQHVSYFESFDIEEEIAQ